MMLELITKILEKENVAVWQIRKTETRRAELYFIKKQLDMPRFALMREYEVSVFRDFEQDGKKYRGVTTCYVEQGQSEEEIDAKIKSALFAAGFVKNPYYDLPDPIVRDKVASVSDLAKTDIREIADAFADAFLSVETDENAFVNSLELFVFRKTVEIMASTGLHVSYDEDRVDGEFVTQCRCPQDVEQYRHFSFNRFDTAALKSMISAAVDDVRKRAEAQKPPRSGTYNILLTGEQVKTLFEYYTMRGNASVLFPGYSTWKIGDKVQRDGTGERLNIDLVATAPFSSDGIAMQDMPYVENGTLRNVWGDTRFSRYLGQKPTGNYQKIRVNNGTVRFADMKTEGTLQTVSFSDFQMDYFTGNFGGEIRLALLCRDGKDIPLTGGSMNAKLSDVENRLVFSLETYEDSEYVGPYAVLIPDVPVAGE